jgi:hypothetical protein
MAEEYSDDNLATYFGDPSDFRFLGDETPDHDLTPAEAARVYGMNLDSLKDLAKRLMSGKGSASEYGGLASILGGLYGANKSSGPTILNPGYQGGIPKYTATRQMLTAPPAGRRPGSGGINYGGDVAYTRAPAPSASPAAVASSGEEPVLAPSNAVKTSAPLPGGIMALPVDQSVMVNAAKGGLLPDGFVVPADVVSHLGNGSSEAGLRILASKFGARPIKGDGDGMSDSIPTTIGGEQPARVANEEAFIPPSVVKRLGDGDTERGAKKLYAMMDRIRKARTGTTEQGKEINPEKFMPGGKVNRYQTGGAITTNPSAGLTSSSLASWAGPYVTDMLGKGQALTEMPYQAYTGPLTAGPSALEQQAFGAASTFQPSAAIGQAAQTAGGIAGAAQGMQYKPVGGLFDTAAAQQYMNPYLQSALEPQMKELKRQSDIQRMSDAARLSKAGAFGGSRQAIMESEAARNLLGKQADILGAGYATAYDKAQQAFAQDQARKIQEAQYGTDVGLRGLQAGLQAAQTQGELGGAATRYGLENIKQLAGLGGVQRGIEAEGIAADRAQFEEARLNPFKMLQFQQSLLSGLPLASQSLYQPGQSNLQQFASGATTVQALLKSLGLIK